jgi:hypothetical protein
LDELEKTKPNLRLEAYTAPRSTTISREVTRVVATWKGRGDILVGLVEYWSSTDLQCEEISTLNFFKHFGQWIMHCSPGPSSAPSTMLITENIIVAKVKEYLGKRLEICLPTPIW